MAETEVVKKTHVTMEIQIDLPEEYDLNSEAGLDKVKAAVDDYLTNSVKNTDIRVVLHDWWDVRTVNVTPAPKS